MMKYSSPNNMCKQVIKREPDEVKIDKYKKMYKNIKRAIKDLLFVSVFLLWL